MKNSSLLAAAAIALTWTCSAGAATALQNLDIGRAVSGLRDLGGSATGISEKDEIALGRELAGRTMGAAPLINDGPLQMYVNRVGRAIAGQSDRRELPWRFGIIDTPSVNAFAAPGGVILVTRGLYELLENEAQLAAVLGHEVAHVTKRHHVTVMQNQMRVAGVANLAGAAVGSRDRLGIFNQILGTGAEIFSKGLDRDAEHEADIEGAILAAKAGYSVSGMVDVLNKLRARAGDPSANLLFETHPHPNDRLDKLAEKLEPEMAKLPAGEEPPLQVAGSSLPPPMTVSGQAVPAPGRGLSAQQQPQQPQQAQHQHESGIPGMGGPTRSGSGMGLGPSGMPGVEDLFRGLGRGRR
jgi:beta-barrel assembly-enhancing protease